MHPKNIYENRSNCHFGRRKFPQNVMELLPFEWMFRKMSKQKYYYSILYMRFETNVFVIHKMHSSVLFLPAHIVRVGRRRHTSQWAMSSMLNFIRTSAALFGEQHITAAFVLIPIWSFSLFPGTPNITFVWRNSNISHTGERHCGKFAWTIAGRRSCNLGQSVGYSR